MTWKYFWWCDKKIIKCHTSIFLWNHVNIVFLQFISYMYYLWNKKKWNKKEKMTFSKIFIFIFKYLWKIIFILNILLPNTFKNMKMISFTGLLMEQERKEKKRNLLCIRPNYPTHVELNLINVCKRLQCIWHILL